MGYDTAIVSIPILIWMFSAVVALSTLASFYIIRADEYDARQKKYQVVIVWFVPVIGAIVCAYFLWQDRKTSKLIKEVGNKTSISRSQETAHYSGGNHRGGR